VPGSGLWSEEETPPEREAVTKPDKPRALGGATRWSRGRRAISSQPVGVPVSAPDGDLGFVADNVEMTRCASCGEMAPGGGAPTRHRDAEWLALAPWHSASCRWIATRGYTDKSEREGLADR